MADQLYKADLYTRVGNFARGFQERQHTIQFLADSHRQAALDALRWLENRRQAFAKLDAKLSNEDPEYEPHFGKLLCIKLWAINPQRMDADGYLGSDHGFGVFEWKCDWGAPVEEYINARLGEAGEHAA
jgi:hypothetical protein